MDKFKLKWWITWCMLHLVALVVVMGFLNYIWIPNNYLYLFLVGFGFSLICSSFRLFLYEKQIVIDRNFIFWSISYSFSLWVSWYLMSFLKFNYFLIFIFSAFFLTLSAFLITIVEFESKRLILTFMFIICILTLPVGLDGFVGEKQALNVSFVGAWEEFKALVNYKSASSVADSQNLIVLDKDSSLSNMVNSNHK